MDQLSGPSGARVCAPEIVRAATVEHDMPTPVTKLAGLMGDAPLTLVALFISSSADIPAIAAEANAAFPGTLVIGCTTAGEISCQGYDSGKIVAVGFPQAHFRANTVVVEDLDNFDATAVIDRMIQSRNALIRETPDWESDFNFLMIDGVSTQEDTLTSQIAAGLGPVPLFGGSAGDDDRFEATFVLHDGAVLTNAAVIAQLRTRCRVKVFKTDHYEPTERRMVVTRASPDRRIVHEINAEPAAREYARMLGKDPEQLSTFTFAANPLVVRIGGRHHVRSIQQVTEEGDLAFFSAIDEGLVLTLARASDMIEHLETQLRTLETHGKPDAILACDCLFRRIEAEQQQLTGRISQLFREHRVVGFSTYGEQINSMHVNQTLTGVAIYPPPE
ncbi:FIST N-terminal domain-containing protein [Mesobacterium sp. TK19101]|uniref:FIST N-terminal domain-containing protein n=1 Tax=Mesobacterium hydrothermale TaxID=3111907 RepID=A0ABU6HJV8_9RHOB|nr:FIST N-terminal domain-containing protein [Mesobacterium sp. TK19101]MEC3861728.1 FIST N-terminal domain-containing protein [Mesobacterium sp. TK19101]